MNNRFSFRSLYEKYEPPTHFKTAEYQPYKKKEKQTYDHGFYETPKSFRSPLSTVQQTPRTKSPKTTQNITSKPTARQLQKKILNRMERLQNDNIKESCMSAFSELLKPNPIDQTIQTSVQLLVQTINEELNRVRQTIIKKQQKSHQYSDGKVLVENARLAAVNQTLAKKLKQLSENAMCQENKQPSEALSSKTLRYSEDRINYLELKLLSEQSKVQQLAEQLTKLEYSMTLLNRQMNELKENNESLRETGWTWRQRYYMQLEEGSRKEQKLELLTQYLKKINERRVTNCDQLKNKGGRLRLVQRSEGFRNEMNILKAIYAGTYSNERDSRMHLAYKADELSVEVGNLQYEIGMIRQRKKEEVPLALYAYWRPTFYNMIEHIQCEVVQKGKEITRQFIQKLRCIMSSKFNEFQLLQCESYTRFPQFVLCWLEKYDFEQTTKEVVLRTPGELSQIRQFYGDLTNLSLDQTWQVITFRQFLFEELSLEELYFYLGCQNYLYRKAAITSEQLYFGDLLILIDYEIAINVVNCILYEFEARNTEFMCQKLNQRSTIKKGVKVVEAGFLLRCLLQFYRAERVNRFRLIRRVCQEKYTECKKYLDFQSVMYVLSHLSEVSYTEKLAIYRQCSSVARGTITPQIVFTVCSQRLVFLKAIKLKNLYRLPYMMNTKDGSLLIQPPLPYAERIFTVLSDLLGAGSDFNQHLHSLGIQQVSNTVDFFRNHFTNRKGKEEDFLMKNRHFLHFLNDIVQYVRRGSLHNLYDILEDADKKTGHFSIELQENDLGDIYCRVFGSVLEQYRQTSEIISWKKKVRKFKYNHAAKKIQRMAREKFIKPYLELYSSMLNKTRNAIGHYMASTAPTKVYSQFKNRKSVWKKG